MSNESPAPVPWRVEPTESALVWILDANGIPVIGGALEETLAAKIILAVNSVGPMREALERMIACAESANINMAYPVNEAREALALALAQKEGKG